MRAEGHSQLFLGHRIRLGPTALSSFCIWLRTVVAACPGREEQAPASRHATLARRAEDLVPAWKCSGSRLR